MCGAGFVVCLISHSICEQHTTHNTHTDTLVMLGEPRPRRLKKSKASGFNIRGNQLFLGGPLTTHRIDIWIGFLFDFCWLRGSVVVHPVYVACIGLYLSCLFVFGIYGVKLSKSRTVLCAARGNVLLCSGCCYGWHMGALWWWISCGFRKIGVWLPASVRWVMWSWTIYVERTCVCGIEDARHRLYAADEFNKGNWLLRGFSRPWNMFHSCLVIAGSLDCAIYAGTAFLKRIITACSARVIMRASILTCFTRSFWVNDLFYYSVLVKLHFWCYIYNLLNAQIESRDSGNLSSVHF